MRAWGTQRAQRWATASMSITRLCRIEDLAAAVEFALDGVADDALVVLGDDGLDGQPVLGRGFDGAHVARAGQRQVERAGDGRGGQGQHIHGGAAVV